MESPRQQQTPDTGARLERISRRAAVRHSGSYSRFIRTMRLVLPLAAAGVLVAAVSSASLQR